MSKKQIEGFTSSLGVPGSADNIQPFLDSLKPKQESNSSLRISLSGTCRSEESSKPLGGPIPPFNELAKQLDPMMPQADYDALRNKYFRDHMLPQIQNPMSIPDLYKQFLAGTERPALLSKMDRVKLYLSLGENAAMRAFIAPGVTQGGFVQQGLEADNAELERVAQREGISTGVTKFVGAGIGMLPDLVVAELASGSVAAEVLGKAAEASKTIELAQKTLKGGMAFASYEIGRA